MGQLLRDEISRGSHVGLDAKSYIDAGKPVPDDIVLPILSQKLNELNDEDFIVDGFPRLVAQGHYIDEYLKNKDKKVSLLIHLLVDFEEIVRRRQAKGQAFQDADRSDNTPEAIANRQKILYEAGIGPILDYYRGQSKLYEVNGNRPIEPIFEDITKAIDSISA